MSQAWLTVRAVLMAAAALLVSTSLAPSAATAREKADRATDDDCAVLSAVFRGPNSLVTLRDLLVGPLDYFTVDAATFQNAFPQLSDTEVADLALGARKSESRSLAPTCNWRKLGFDWRERSLHAADYPVNTVSRPIISASGTIAFVITYAQWASLAGEGRNCLLRKRNDVWRVESCVFDGTVS
jgi:hypothetical protein